MDQKWYAGSQVIDEVRHVEVFSKFLQRKMGVIHPIDPTLKVLLDKLLAAPTWKTKVLGMQTLFEGMAVGIMELVQRANSNPLIADIITRCTRTSKHAAGVLARRVWKEATPEELIEMGLRLRHPGDARANQQLAMKLFGPKYDLDGQAVVQIMHCCHNGPAISESTCAL
jgi:hypothetical protein